MILTANISPKIKRKPAEKEIFLYIFPRGEGISQITLLDIGKRTHCQLNNPPPDLMGK